MIGMKLKFNEIQKSAETLMYQGLGTFFEIH